MLWIERKLRSFFEIIQVNYPNYYIIIVAIAVIMWVNGVSGLVDYYIVLKNKPLRHFLVMMFGLFVIYYNDGTLSELHYVDNNGKIKRMMEWSAVQRHPHRDPS